MTLSQLLPRLSFSLTWRGRSNKLGRQNPLQVRLAEISLLRLRPKRQEGVAVMILGLILAEGAETDFCNLPGIPAKPSPQPLPESPQKGGDRRKRGGSPPPDSDGPLPDPDEENVPISKMVISLSSILRPPSFTLSLSIFLTFIIISSSFLLNPFLFSSFFLFLSFFFSFFLLFFSFLFFFFFLFSFFFFPSVACTSPGNSSTSTCTDCADSMNLGKIQSAGRRP